MIKWVMKWGDIERRREKRKKGEGRGGEGRGEV